MDRNDSAESPQYVVAAKLHRHREEEDVEKLQRYCAENGGYSNAGDLVADEDTPPSGDEARSRTG